MKLSIKLALLSAASGFLATAAFADTTVASTPKNSVYVSGDAGYGMLSTPNQNLGDVDGRLITGASHSNGSFAGGVNVGFNHAITNNVLVGAEVGYDYNGQAKYTLDSSILGSATAKITSTSFNFLGTGTYLFTTGPVQGLNLFAKAGAARVEQKGTFDMTGFEEGSTTNTEFQPMVAGGVGYQVKMVNFFVQYAHIFGKNAQSFNELVNESTGDFNGVVAVDTFKAGVAVNLAI